MVAEFTYANPAPVALPAGGVALQNGESSSQKQHCQGTPSQDGRRVIQTLGPMVQGSEGVDSEHWPQIKLQLTANKIKFEEDHEESSEGEDFEEHDGSLVIDLKKEEHETSLVESDEEEYPSVMPSESETQCKKEIGSPGSPKKRQQRMNHGKKWLMQHLIFVGTTISMVSLNDIEKTYLTACQKDGKEPLNTNVLARLIHELFPQVEKYRPGSRGNQKIHYRNLHWRRSVRQDQMKHAVPTTSQKAASLASPKSTVPLPKIEGKVEKPFFSVESKNTIQDSLQQKNINENMLKAKEALARAASQALSEDEDSDAAGCEDGAKRLAQVIRWLKGEGKWNILLKTFAHSASCNISSCSPLCLMFRRVRRHVVSARHPCYVLRIYSLILKLHVGNCDSNQCGMTACPALRASKQMKRGRDEEPLDNADHQLYQQDKLQHATKRLSIQGSHLSLKIRPPSPALSLPDSQPSTPSPPNSPPITISSSDCRIPPLCPVWLAGGPSELGA